MTPAHVLLSSAPAPCPRPDSSKDHFYFTNPFSGKTRLFLVKIRLLLLNCFLLTAFFATAQPELNTGVAVSVTEEHSAIPALLPDSTKKALFGLPGKNRRMLITGINVVGYGGSLVLLNEAWYKGYARSSFHTFDDSREWLQIDKAGHAWTAYNTGRASTALWEWAGLSHKKAVLTGGLSGAAYLTAIEFLDAYSTKWGWSWSDIGANIFGSGLFMSQELLWNEQRIQFKFSFHKNNYKDPQLEQSLPAFLENLYMREC